MALLKKTILGIVGNKFLAPARVEQIDTVGERFRLITLACEDYIGTSWSPGSKMKLDTGDWETRTYTPVSIDESSGRLHILIYLHGSSAGANWARTAKPGDWTRIGRPRSSLEFDQLGEPVTFFGDETSFAAAWVLQKLRPASRLVFEVAALTDAQLLIHRLALNQVELIQTTVDATHSPRVASAIRTAMTSLATSCLVMTGNSRSIQALRRIHRAEGMAGIRYHIAPYWTPGKAGQD